MAFLKYRGELISKNSHAAELLEKKEFGKLDFHLEDLRKECIKRCGPLPPYLENYKIGEHPESWK